jgi:hypothetical protein
MAILILFGWETSALFPIVAVLILHSPLSKPPKYLDSFSFWQYLLSEILTCLSYMISDAEHLFMYTQGIFVS